MLKERKSVVVVGFNLLFTFIMHIHTDWLECKSESERNI